MLRTVHLHGRLGTRFGKTYQLNVNSTAEAVRALVYQLPGFREYFDKRRYVISLGEGEALGMDQIQMSLGKSRDIHITPAGAVAGLETIILIGALVLTAALSVITILMMPKVPKPGDREEATKTTSFIFDGAQNNTEQGHPVPLVYGRFRGSTNVVSSGINTTDVPLGNSSMNPAQPDAGQWEDWVQGDDGEQYEGYVGSTDGVQGGQTRSQSAWTVEKGGGKGGGGSRAAQEDPNNLQSQATAKVLEIVSEGEIRGLVDGLKSVYFDETPLQNEDDSFNFAGVTVESRVGLPDQDFIPGFTQTENSTAVDTQVTVDVGPITQTISDTEVTVARVTLRVPQLYQQDTENGDLKATAVSVKISVQADGGGYTDIVTVNFNGKTNSGYQRSIDVRLPSGTSRQVRVTRLTADAEVASLSNDTYWDILTEIVEAKLSYPDTALIGLTVDARQFGNHIPKRSYDIYGLLVEVPSNYNPITRVYTGVWDGTFIRAWTDNPAWIFRDVIVNRRYGLGGRIPESAVDIWSLYSIAQYCDELVSDFFGGTQPRYTINCCIMTAVAAYDLIAAIASNFRGWAYWGSGTIMAVQDRPEDPSILVTPSNVDEGVIEYGRVTPMEKRRSAAVVYWNDPEDEWRLTPEIVEDPDLIRRFGRRPGDEVTAFGVTNRGQANRFARWVLEDESPGSNTTAAYGVGDDHSFVEPGRIASVSDPMFSQNRRGGRIRSSSANQVVIDSPFTLVGGQTYTMRVMLPDGTTRTRTITNSASTTDTINLSGSAFATNPNPGAVWTIESNLIANRQFRVRGITADDPPHKVQAVLHDPTKYDRVELDRDISSPIYLDVPQGPLVPPTDLFVLEFLLRDGNAAVPSVQVSWAASTDPRVAFYQAQYKRPGQNWEPFADGVDVSRVVRGTEAGTWGFRVRALDTLGRKTAWVVDEAVVLDGQVDSLPEVDDLILLVADAGFAVKLSWTPPIDPRPLHYEVLYCPANDLGSAVSLGYVDTTEFPVAVAGFYWVRTTFIAAFSSTPPSIEVTEAALTIAAGLSPYLTNEAVSLAASSVGVVSSYTGASGSFVVMQGTDDVSTNFALSTPSGGDPQSLTETYTGQDYSVSGGFDAAEPVASLRIRATGSGAFAGVIIDKVFSLSKSKAGVDGSWIDTRFIRSLARPSTPTGDSPAGWTNAIPPGTSTIWQILGPKLFPYPSGALIDVWSDPESIVGLTPRGAYNSGYTYYLNSLVLFGGGSYVAVQDNFSGQAPSGTGEATAYWDVYAAPGSPGEPGDPPSGFSADIDVPSGAAVSLRTLANDNGYTGLSDATITFHVQSGAVVRGLGGSGGVGIDCGNWPYDDYTISITIVVHSGGIVDGGGGDGGSADGGYGGYGGDAFFVRGPITGGITINSGGIVRAGGGGGGAGSSFFDLSIFATRNGSGGGGGAPNGAGGAAATGGTDGVAGSAGTTSGGGNGGADSFDGAQGGSGGTFAVAGDGGYTTYPGGPNNNGGTAGYAIRKNGHTCAHTNNGTMTGTAG